MTVSTAPTRQHLDAGGEQVAAQECGGFGASGHRRRDVRVTTSDGVRLAVRDHGPKSAERTIVFLHGLCLDQMSWSRQICSLNRRYGSDVRVVSYDHRGHGRSSTAPANTYTITRLADDLCDVLAALSVRGEVTLVGHSMGAMCILSYLGSQS